MHHKSKGQKARAQTRLPPEEDPEFQIAPMIDILLVLLVFFMSITSTEVLQVNEAVRLPVAKDGKDPKDIEGGQVTVNVLWNAMTGAGAGTFEIDNKTYTQATELTPFFEAKVAQSPDMRVLIRADREVKYDFLKSLLKAIGAAKVSNVTFSVVDKEGGK
ncbi:MAG TPA: biopolymer transporter ExbD [Chthoniobacteraceae bacterium]|jgi:biopolymer transport protein ExbD